jgi:cardiolipin synthase
MLQDAGTRLRWLSTGREGLAAMLGAIQGARRSIALEIYIFEESPVGREFLAALCAAARRGVRVRVLVDTFGSFELRSDFFQPLIEAGAEFRWFNPRELGRFIYRDHRKLLVVDDQVAFVCGFNIGTHYDGDGVVEGWRDLGVEVTGGFVPVLAEAFAGMFGAAGFRHALLARFRRHLVPQEVRVKGGSVFLLSPGRERNPAREALSADILRARCVRLTTAYFLPPRRLRTALARAAREGARVQLLLPGRSDVRLAQWAARGQYGRLLRAGVEIHEYQPAVLHAKRYLLDDIVYVGSANLDLRSLNINYELLLRVEDPALAAEGHRQFELDLAHSRQIRRETWRLRPWWNRLGERLAGFFLVQMDARFALRQLHRLREGPLRLGVRKLARVAAAARRRGAGGSGADDATR